MWFHLQTKDGKLKGAILTGDDGEELGEVVHVNSEFSRTHVKAAFSGSLTLEIRFHDSNELAELLTRWS